MHGYGKCRFVFGSGVEWKEGSISNIIGDESSETSAAARERSFSEMVEIALDVARLTNFDFGDSAEKARNYLERYLRDADVENLQ